MSYNSTHTALLVMAAVIIAAFHYSIDLVLLIPVIAPIGAYVTMRERQRVQTNNKGDSSRFGESEDLSEAAD